jgi:hypothetical protein
MLGAGEEYYEDRHQGRSRLLQPPLFTNAPTVQPASPSLPTPACRLSSHAPDGGGRKSTQRVGIWATMASGLSGPSWVPRVEKDPNRWWRVWNLFGALPPQPRSKSLKYFKCLGIRQSPFCRIVTARQSSTSSIQILRAWSENSAESYIYWCTVFQALCLWVWNQVSGTSLARCSMIANSECHTVICSENSHVRMN